MLSTGGSSSGRIWLSASGHSSKVRPPWRVAGVLSGRDESSAMKDGAPRPPPQTRRASQPRIAAIRLLVTGNQGFIGPVLTRVARARGHQVTGLDIGYFADCLAGPEPDALPDRQIRRDIREVA